MRHYFKFCGFAIACLLGAALFCGCGRPQAQASGNGPEMPPASVRVQRILLQTQTATEDVMAAVRPRSSATLESKIPGFVLQMNVVTGQTVTNGECLAMLDSKEIESRLDQSRAGFQQARQDWKRISGLYSQEAATRADYDAAKARYEMAQASLAESQAMLGYCRVLAPFDGVITRKLADVGDLALPGKPLLQMESLNDLRLEADVPESLIGNIAIGDELSASIPSVTNDIPAAVAEISPAADVSTRTFLIKLDFTPVKGIRSGQFARVSIPLGKIRGLFAPESALVERGQMDMMFVVENSRAVLRLVKAGPVRHGLVEVLSGLNTGDTIVTLGGDSLEDGQPLMIQP